MDADAVVAAHIAAQKKRLAEELSKEEVFVNVQKENVVVQNLLGIVVVTSVLSIHPSTEMIEAVLATHIKVTTWFWLCVDVDLFQKQARG
jgi:hypothetical protein